MSQYQHGRFSAIQFNTIPRLLVMHCHAVLEHLTEFTVSAFSFPNMLRDLNTVPRLCARCAR